jgi:hypothetical protein
MEQEEKIIFRQKAIPNSANLVISLKSFKGEHFKNIDEVRE